MTSAATSGADGLREPAPKPRLGKGRTAFVVVAAFLLFATFGIAVQLLDIGFGLWFTEAFVFFAVPWIALRRRGFHPTRDAGLRFEGVRPLALGALCGALNFVFAAVPLGLVSRGIFARLAPGLLDLFALDVFEGRGWIERAALALGMVVAAPIGEEYFFRGFFLRRLLVLRGAGRRAMGPVVLVALIFAAFHLEPIDFVARLEIGVLLGLLFVRTGSLWPAIGAHAANNLLASGIALLQPGNHDVSEPTTMTYVVAAGVAVVGVPAMFFLLRIVPEGGPDRFADTPPRDRLGWARFALAWCGAAIALVGLFALVDARGIQLNLVDVSNPLPKQPRDASSEEQSAREELRALRQDALSGRTTVASYTERRRALATRFRR